MAESNGRLLLSIWRDSLHVTCGLTACTPGSAPGPTLGNEYGKTLPFSLVTVLIHNSVHFGFPLPFWAPRPPRHCQGCRWLVTPLCSYRTSTECDRDIDLCTHAELPRVALDSSSAETVADVGDDVAMTCTGGGSPTLVRIYWPDLPNSARYTSATLPRASRHTPAVKKPTSCK